MGAVVCLFPCFSLLCSETEKQKPEGISLYENLPDCFQLGNDNRAVSAA